MEQRRILRVEPDRSLVEHARLDDVAAADVNDMLVDDRGRAYVGDFGFDYHAAARDRSAAALYAPPGPPRAPLVVLGADGRRIHVTAPLLFPNGCALLDAGRTLVVAETLGLRLTAFPVADDGALGDARPWATLVSPPLWRALTAGGVVGRVTRAVSALLERPWIAERSTSPIAPDGIAGDPDGETIWVANALRSECVRIAAGGAVLQRVRTTQPALSCVVGGPDRDELYVATCPVLDPLEAARTRRGRIERASLPPR